MRLDKFLANASIGSRSEVKKMVKRKHVKVNDIIVIKPEMNVEFSDIILVYDEVVIHEENTYLMLHKPAGYVCANKDKLHKTVINIIDYPKKEELQICGRLDMDVTGLVILTNDGEFNHVLTTPKKGHSKEYVVTYKGDTSKLLAEYTEGLVLTNDNNFQTLPFKVEIKSESVLHIIVLEGRFHLVKNIVAELGLKLLHLHRIKVGPYTLPDDLAEGELRQIENLL
jgi:16S rRNA pseudouridine516 synthase